MRRKDREIDSKDALKEILDACKVLRLAMAEEGIPYVVPLNFGYEFAGHKLTLFFHSAREGKKIDILKKDPRVCFEMDCSHELVGAGAACDYSYRYSSVIGDGTARFITEREEKIHALNAIMKHQMGRDDFTYEDARLRGVEVFEVVSQSYSGKSSK